MKCPDCGEEMTLNQSYREPGPVEHFWQCTNMRCPNEHLYPPASDNSGEVK